MIQCKTNTEKVAATEEEKETIEHIISDIKKYLLPNDKKRAIN